MAEIAVGRVLSGEREIARAAIVERAARAAAGFAALGVRAGDAIAVMLRNDFPFFEASYRGAAARRLLRAGELARQDAGDRLCARAIAAPRPSWRMPTCCRNSCRPCREGVPLLVVPTPPEIAAAYGIAGRAHAPPPAGAVLWDDWLAGLRAAAQGAAAAPSRA